MKKSKSLAAEPAWSITAMSVGIEHTSVYANGKQQALVVLYVEAALNGVRVALTQAERASVRLIDYQKPDAEIPLSEDGSVRHKGWSTQTVDRGWTNETGTRASLPSPQAGGDYVTSFVDASIGSDGDATRAPLAIGFIITGDNDWSYRSDGYAISPTGEKSFQEKLVSGGDKKLRAEVPPTFLATDFVLDQRGGRSSEAGPDAGIFDEVATLSIVRAGRSVAIRHMVCEPVGMIHWQDNLPDTHNPCFIGSVGPGETAIRWQPDVPVGREPLPTLDRAISGKGAFMLCGRVDIPRTEHGGAPQGPMRLTITDDFGNQTSPYLVFVEGTRDVLAIRDRAVHE